MICAVTKEKCLGYQLIKGGVNAKIFGSFLLLLLKNYPQITEQPANFVFHLDNARIHQAKILKPILNRFEILFNAPYSLFLSPIEEYFSLTKFYL